MARWCKDMKAWRTEGLKNVTFDLEERTVSFQTFYFSPVAVMTVGQSPSCHHSGRSKVNPLPAATVRRYG